MLRGRASGWGVCSQRSRLILKPVPSRLPATVFGTLSLFVGLSILMVSRVVLPLDDQILEWVGRVRSPELIDLALLASFLADGVPIAIIGLGICALLWARAGRRTALSLLFAGLTGELIYVAAKSAFGRPRPDIIEKLGSAGWHAYPSGHTMLATIIYGLALTLLAATTRGVVRVLLLVLAVLIPLSVAASRVVLGVHYPSDVLAGLTLGSALLFWWRDWSSSCASSRSASTA